uniref:Uncharacterized protein n=1 Tax=Rhizophora mucronata TaxID=61149 RepID=A0A2P2QCD0_RHIMU
MTEGIWKCHHCNWTYCVTSFWSDPTSNLNSCTNMLMNVGNFNQQGPCFIFETKGQLMIISRKF